MTALEALRNTTLFRDFTETGLNIFAAIAVERAIPAGATLFAENMVGQSLFVVKSGTVKLTHKAAEGERELAVVGPGDLLGELALLSNTVRLVSAIALTPCEVLEIAQRDFVRLQPQKPQACLKLALAIAQGLALRAAESRDALRDVVARKPGP